MAIMFFFSNVDPRKWIPCLLGWVALPLAAALPTNSGFESSNLKPWVLRIDRVVAEVSEDGAHEGKRALKLTPEDATAKSFKVELSQLLPWDAQQALQIQAWVRGRGLEQAQLILVSFDEQFSQMEEWVIAETSSSEAWQRLAPSGEALELPKFTKQVQIKLVIDANGSEPVWVDQVELSQATEPKPQESAEKFSSVLHQQVGQLKQAIQTETPQVLLLGDRSMLGWKRFAEKLMNDLEHDRHVLSWGFLGDASTEQIHQLLKQEQVRVEKHATVVLGLGYHDVLHAKLSGKASAEQVLALRSWLLESEPTLTVEVFALLDQHVDAPAEWLKTAAEFNQTLRDAGLDLISLEKKPSMDRSQGVYLEQNYLPNAEAREALMKALKLRLQSTKKSDLPDERR